MARFQYSRNEIYIETIHSNFKSFNLNTIMNNNKKNHLTIINNKSTITPKIYTLNNLQHVAKWKDPRLELIEIPKGLIEVLQNSGFTMEKILDSEPSVIAEELGIDSYVGEIIFKETSKTINKINPPDLLLIN